MNSVGFTYAGAPVAKGRPRFTMAGRFPRSYTPKKTAEYEERIRYRAKRAMDGRAPLEGPLSCSLVFLMPIPTSFTKAQRRASRNGLLLHAKKPDLDNLIKAVLDACNGIVWKDDSQIVNLHVWKRYADEPGVEIIVEEFRINIAKRGAA